MRVIAGCGYTGRQVLIEVFGDGHDGGHGDGGAKMIPLAFITAVLMVCLNALAGSFAKSLPLA